ncbi:MAG: serine--tRNA ligase, partial [Steroidobacteraceae bacterium]|nr:serine--tRNA ligase [Steroidobacteraceae bacterium]MDW8259171.1 aminoacyl--tRNA ligase-related protein [Gammaproteobacteria bacterium]
MIDIKRLRTDPDGVAANLARRGFVLDIDALRELEERRRLAQLRVDQLRAERNAQAKSIGAAKARGEDFAPLVARGEQIAAALAEAEAESANLQSEFDRWMLELPNLLHPQVPPGHDASANVELRRWGEPRALPFKARDHVELAQGLGGLDADAAGRIAGARFTVLQGLVASLHRALAQFMLDLHVREHGYAECYVPYLVNAAAVTGTGQLPKFEMDLFRVPHSGAVERGGSGWYLIPTAEVPLTNLVRDRILDPAQLPLRWVAHTPCFRSEAGSYGKDTRGLIRQHQFDKV